jgi:hypothetical protein
VGLSSGITVALISPVCAFLFGIAPNIITVIPIMLGNSCYVLLLHLLVKKFADKPVFNYGALAVAAIAKFAVLYLLVVQVVCNLASGALLGQKLGSFVLLAPPMLKMLPVMFSWPQLVTALAGGILALLIRPILRKALHR